LCGHVSVETESKNDEPTWWQPWVSFSDGEDEIDDHDDSQQSQPAEKRQHGGEVVCQSRRRRR
jgi:hypothetical protein